MIDRQPKPGHRLVMVGIILLALPLMLFLMAWERIDFEDAGLIASWPALLMWPAGLLMIVAGLSGRLIRRLDDRWSDHGQPSVVEETKEIESGSR